MLFTYLILDLLKSSTVFFAESRLFDFQRCASVGLYTGLIKPPHQRGSFLQAFRATLRFPSRGAGVTDDINKTP